MVILPLSQSEPCARRDRYGLFLLTAILILLVPAVAGAVGNFHGHAQFEKVVDDPSKGYYQLYEYKAFLTPTGSGGTGFSYHIGDPGTAIHPYEGCITWPNVPAGTYTLMTSWGEFPWRGKIVPNVVISNNQQTTQDANEPLDYSGYYTKSDWDPSGAGTIYQTFVAKGTAITRISFSKADSNSTGDVVCSVHVSNGGNVETWSQVGPSRTRGRAGFNSDMWFSWNSGEVPTTPGQTYAVKLTSNTGNLQPFWMPDSFYPNGSGYRNNQSGTTGHDYHVVVFSDRDGTINTMSVRSNPYVNLAGWRDQWAQSYTALGNSFAGSTLMATIGGSSGWQYSVDVSIHANTPNGTQIGPTKTMPCAFAPFAGNAGVAFAPGEVPTTPGNTYWIVYRRNGGGGFNAYRMNEGNTYSGGTAAYFDGSWNNQSFDLFMNLYEYKTGTPVDTPTPGPTATPTPTPPVGANILDGLNHSFESSSGNTHTPWINSGQVGTNGAFPNPGTAQDGSQWAGYSYGGGQTITQELYQNVSVTPGTPYRLGVYMNLGGTHGSATGRLLYTNGVYNGTGGGTEVDSLTWVHPDAFYDWTLVSGDVTPTGNTLGVILRWEIDGYGGGVNMDHASLIALSGGPTPTPTNSPTQGPSPTPTHTPTQGPSPSPTPVQVCNFTNPGFESGIMGWSRLTNNSAMYVAGSEFSYNPHTGSQMFGGTHSYTDAGAQETVYQNLCTTPGQEYTFTAWAITGQQGGAQTDVRVRLVGDLSGGTNFTDLSGWQSPTSWTQISHTFTATGSSVTLGMELNQQLGLQWNHYYVDDANLEATGLPPTATPTPTSPPTATPTATPMVSPTPIVGNADLVLIPDDMVIRRPPASAGIASPTYLLEIGIENVGNLGAFEYELAYNPQAMQVAGPVTVGSFLGSTGNTVVPVGPDIDNITGTLAHGAFTFGDNPGPDGNGILARVPLIAPPITLNRSTNLNIVHLLTTDVNGFDIPISTTPGLLANCHYADQDCSGDITIVDVQTVAGMWNQSGLDPMDRTPQDVDWDGDVDIVDIQLTAALWNTSEPW